MISADSMMPEAFRRMFAEVTEDENAGVILSNRRQRENGNVRLLLRG